MKLRGTRTESIIRDDLLTSETLVRKDVVIMNFLRKRYGNVKSVYVLACTPVQGEDVYGILVNGEVFVNFEISRASKVISGIEESTVSEYSKRLRGRLSNLEILIALDLANNN